MWRTTLKLQRSKPTVSRPWFGRKLKQWAGWNVYREDCHLWGCRKKRQKRSQTEAKQDINLHLEVSSVRLSRHSLCVYCCGTGPALASVLWADCTEMVLTLQDASHHPMFYSKGIAVGSGAPSGCFLQGNRKSCLLRGTDPKCKSRVFPLVLFSLGVSSDSPGKETVCFR